MNNSRINPYIPVLFFAMFIFGINSQALGTLITRIIAHYDIQMAQAGLLSSFLSIGSVTAAFTVAIFAGRVNKMILLGISIFLLAGGLFLLSRAPVFGILMAGFSLLGIFGATMDTLINSLVADLMPGKISTGMSLLHGIFGLGGLSGPIIIDFLARSLSWSLVYLTLSIAFLVFLVFYSVLLRWQWKNLVIVVSGGKKAGFDFSDIVQFLKKKKHILLMLTIFFYGGNQITMIIWVKRYVEIFLDVPAWGAFALSSLWLGIALSRLIVAPTVRASSPRKIFIGNLVSAAVVTAGLLSQSAPGILIASFASGLASGFTIPLILALGCEWNREKTAMGTMVPYTALFSAAILAPPLSGLIGDLAGIPWSVAVSAFSAVFAALFAGILDAHIKNEKTPQPEAAAREGKHG